METIWLEEENEQVNWEGPGWYASRQESGCIATWQVGTNPDERPETYTMGLGTPFWMEEKPI